MNSSDIIAIVAIVISATVSITSVYIAFLIHKQNITAKRLEIALGKQLEIFSLLGERMQSIAKIALDLDEQPNSSIDHAFLKRLEMAHNNFLQSYDLVRIYLPPQLENRLDEFEVSVLHVLTNKALQADEQNDQLRNIVVTQYEAVSMIRKYIGIE
ncbi:MAG: hypothetical protein H3C52_06350 [Anaerolineales bacterium]|nr:hypothetical protein [Anaerolineales bacterium]MCZ2288399.1 hypothetical protein [Anaerolineales bacterium]